MMSTVGDIVYAINIHTELYGMSQKLSYSWFQTQHCKPM